MKAFSRCFTPHARTSRFSSICRVRSRHRCSTPRSPRWFAASAMRRATRRSSASLLRPHSTNPPVLRIGRIGRLPTGKSVMRSPMSFICGPSTIGCSNSWRQTAGPAGSPRRWRGSPMPRHTGMIQARRGVAFACAAGSMRASSVSCARWRRGGLIRDEAVLEIAAHAPKTIEALARSRSLGKGVAEGRLGNEILEAVRRGLANSMSLEPPPSRADTPPGLGPLIELLRVLLKQRCEDHQVAQKLVATAEDLEAIAADDNASVPALSGWRHEIFGKDALALKHGRLALTVRRNRIALVEVGDQAR